MHRRPHTPRSSKNSRPALLAVLLVAQLMVILDISAVNLALPDMAIDLGIRGGDITWTITSYSLVFGSLLLLGGRAADLLGPRGRRRGAVRGQSRPGSRRRPAVARGAVDHHHHLHRLRAHQGARSLGR